MQNMIQVTGPSSRLGLRNSKLVTRLSGGETLLGRQLELISSSPLLFQEKITRVVGFKQHLYAEAFSESRKISIHKYEVAITAKSFLVGQSGITNESTLSFRRDLFYVSEVITHLENVVSRKKVLFLL